MTPCIGLGAGGHAKVVLDTLQCSGRWQVLGLLDPCAELWGKQLLGVSILGGDELLAELLEQGCRHAFVGLGGGTQTAARRRVYEMAVAAGLTLIAARHPTAVISPSARLGQAPTVFAHAVVNAGAMLGDNVLVNTAAVVEHDCIVGDHVHLAPGSLLTGAVQVGDGACIGARACVRPGIRIGRGAVVGAGAVVVRNVPENTVVVGVPARRLEQ